MINNNGFQKMSTFMPRNKIAQIYAWLIDSPPPIFDMNRWLHNEKTGMSYASLGALEKSLSTKLNEETTTCGFAACMAGTIQFKAAKTDADKLMDVGEFANKWIGWKKADKRIEPGFFCPLFVEPRLYGEFSLDSVTIESVTKTLKLIHNSKNMPYVLISEYELWLERFGYDEYSDGFDDNDDDASDLSLAYWHALTNQKLRPSSKHIT
jgi:hypothetical protein